MACMMKGLIVWMMAQIDLDPINKFAKEIRVWNCNLLMVVK